MLVGVNARTFSVAEPRGSVQASLNSVSHLSQIQNLTVRLYGHNSVYDNFNETDVISDGFRWNFQVFGLLWEQIFLPRLLQESEVDIFFCPNSDGPVRAISTPTIVRIHDIFGYKGYGPQAYTALQRVRLPQMVSAADGIIAPTQKVKGEIESRFEATNVEVVHNGLDDRFFGNYESEPIPLPDEYILYVGGTDPRKNIEGLLNGFEELKQNSFGGLKLVLVGPHSRFIDGVNSEIDASAQDDIINLGYVNEAELMYVYENANLYVHPSFDEGFGLTPLEAMACGTPVASSNREPMPEVLGDAPIYFDPDDPTDIASAAAEILDSREVRNRSIAAGKEQAEAYRWSDAACDIHSILKEYY